MKEINKHLEGGDTDLDSILLKIKNRCETDNDDCTKCGTSAVRGTRYDNTTKNPLPVNLDSNLDDIQNNVFQDDNELDKRNPIRAIRSTQDKPNKVPSLNPKLPNDGFELKGEDDDNSLRDGENLILIGDNGEPINIGKHNVKLSLIEQVQKNMFRQYKQDVKVRMGEMDSKNDNDPYAPNDDELPRKIRDRKSKLVPNKIGHDKPNLTDERDKGEWSNDTNSPQPIEPMNGDRLGNDLNTTDPQYQFNVRV